MNNKTLYIQDENKRLCAKFEEISGTALSSPNNTEELVSLKQKVSHIQTVVMVEQVFNINDLEIIYFVVPISQLGKC